MPIFKEEPKGKLIKLKSFSAEKEKQIQDLVEKNLFEVLDMYFLASEYTTTFGGRIDTLAVDTNGAPVIIEYKRNKNDNVINQGLSYLRWLKAQKIEFFEMLIIKKLGEKYKDLKVDWLNPRVICIAESYSKFDIDTVEVIPMRIELFKYRYYENGIFSLEALNVSEQTSKSSNIEILKEVIIDSNFESHLEKSSEVIREIFEDLRSKIFELDENIKEKSTNFYISYRVSKNFTEIHVGKNQLKILLRPIDYIDPEHKVEKIPDTYQWTLDRKIILKSKIEIDYVFSIIEQSYKSVL